LVEESQAAVPSRPVLQKSESTLRIVLSVMLRVVLVIGGFFAVCMGYLHFFGAP
jgi:hypothetical protein